MRRLALRALLPGIVLVAAGCGTGGISKSNDAASGKTLFVQKCATCHTLKAAGTSGQIGPNLDDAFAADRKQGFKPSTFQQVVLDQIKFAACTPQIRKDSPSSCMPQNLVKGKDAEAVAAYVAQNAGNPNAVPSGGGKIQATNGKDIFAQAGCAGCHTLKDASAVGKIGPNLDQAKPPKSLVIDRVTNGKGVMPSFEDKLSKQQIDAVADYVSSVAGK